MKYFFLLLVFAPGISWGQTSDTLARWAYCEIVGTQKFLNPDKVVVSIDFGQAASRDNFWGVNDQRIRDDKGKVASFNSMVDALNYMGERGWEFLQAYTISSGNSNVYHWLLRADKAQTLTISRFAPIFFYFFLRFY